MIAKLVACAKEIFIACAATFPIVKVPVPIILFERFKVKAFPEVPISVLPETVTFSTKETTPPAVEGLRTVKSPATEKAVPDPIVVVTPLFALTFKL